MVDSDWLTAVQFKFNRAKSVTSVYIEILCYDWLKYNENFLGLVIPEV